MTAPAAVAPPPPLTRRGLGRGVGGGGSLNRDGGGEDERMEVRQQTEAVMRSGHVRDDGDKDEVDAIEKNNTCSVL